jgi:rod shape determining protein RodA
MNLNQLSNESYEKRLKSKLKALRWNKIHLDPLLLVLLCLLGIFGMAVLYSACDQNKHSIYSQLIHLSTSAACLLAVAQVSPVKLKSMSPWLYFFALLLLGLVPVLGHTSQGAKRWLGLMSIHIQPSEIMKLAMPMMLAWIIDQYHGRPKGKILAYCIISLVIPVLLIIKQPDLGTAIVIAVSGLLVILLAGIEWKIIAFSLLALILSSPIAWHFLHGYQKSRILTLIDPQRDPLGSGYNIIQSKIAVGSGGIFGKGWLQGTQSHLAFLPTHTTDFIFAVNAEELGFMGCLLLLTLLCCILSRCIIIANNAQSSYSRLLTGAISYTFILSALINIGMVVGIVPVVGIPLPLFSYGGSYLVTTFIGFGIIMSVQTHKKLWSS